MKPAPTVLLIVSSAKAPANRVAGIAGQLGDAGAHVRLVAHRWTAPVPAGIDARDVHQLADAAQAHGPAFRRALRGADEAQRLSLHVQHDEWVDEHVRPGGLVVPIDENALPAAQWLVRRHPALRLVRRPRRAVALVKSGETPAPTARLRLSRLGRSGRMPPSLGRRLVMLPRLSQRRRAHWAELGVHELLHEGRLDAAANLVGKVAPLLADPRLRADLLGGLTSQLLTTGDRVPMVQEAVRVELASADRSLAGGDAWDAAGAFGEALRTAFHKTLHFHRLESPLAVDPAGFTEPLRSSATAQAVRAPSAPDRERPQPPINRPTRLLIAVRGTQAFIGQIRAHFEQLPDFEVRLVAFDRLPGLMRFVNSSAAFAEQVLCGKQELTEAAERLFRPHLDWADVVLVDWCTEIAALLSRIDPGDTRVIVRLHSYEAFTRWPHLVDFSRVDDIIFVSDHLRRLVDAAVPGLRESRRTRRHILANGVDLGRTARSKPADARFMLGLVGASKVVKDPRWALETLRLLRQEERRYRLRVIGGHFQDVSPATHAYAEALAADLAELEATGAVERTGFTDDVPRALEGVGVILSSSVRESFHVGLVEGAASGAVPVVRNWPFFPGAPAELFPADWVVDTPEQAAARILETTASQELWRDEGARASREVLGKWDWSVVAPAYERLLRDED